MSLCSFVSSVSDLIKDVKTVTGTYISQDAPVLKSGVTNKTKFTTDDVRGDSSVNYENMLSYYFGIDKLKIGYAQPDVSGAYLSETITINSCSFIQLQATESGGSGNSIEYSIVEGDTETPIIPLGCDKILSEKIFFGLPTRFTIDNNNPVTIYKNGEKTAMSSLGQISFSNEGGNNDIYTIDYTPLMSAQKYIPQGNAIRVKIVQRCLFGALPAVISNLMIQKHGGVMPWTTSE